MRHRIRHHVNRPVLHFGLFTDAQMLPAAGLFALAAGWFYAGGGGLVARAMVTALLLLPVGVMVVDNRVGGLVVERARAFVRWYRQPGMFAPGAEQAEGYALRVDAEDEWVLERERLAGWISRRRSRRTAERESAWASRWSRARRSERSAVRRELVRAAGELLPISALGADGTVVLEDGSVVHVVACAPPNRDGMDSERWSRPSGGSARWRRRSSRARCCSCRWRATCSTRPSTWASTGGRCRRGTGSTRRR